MRIVVHAAAALIGIVALPGAALAQSWVPGSEVVGQPIQVTTNGVTNTVYLDNGGAARIMTASGHTVPATWTAASNQLCLINGAAQELLSLFQPLSSRPGCHAD